MLPQKPAVPKIIVAFYELDLFTADKTQLIATPRIEVVWKSLVQDMISREPATWVP
jgi:hypothetical protein